jgi:hypothetical protein
MNAQNSLDQSILILLAPVAREKGHDLVSPPDKLCPIPPLAIQSIGEGDLFGATRVPGVFGGSNLLHRSFTVERRERGRAMETSFYLH